MYLWWEEEGIPTVESTRISEANIDRASCSPLEIEVALSSPWNLQSLSSTLSGLPRMAMPEDRFCWKVHDVLYNQKISIDNFVGYREGVSKQL